MRSHLCSTLTHSLVNQATATAELVPAARHGDLVSVQDCLSKMANVETKLVRCIFNCDVLSGIYIGIVS